jgi:biotin-dependent carboxylase-like uncharacterized protein
MTRLTVVFAGPQVTVQDAGRPGAMRYGVPASGPMDRKAFAIANAVLGNAPGTPVIEVSRGGLTLDCAAGAVTLAVAGGGFILQHGATRAGSWRILTLRAGERLALRPGPWGSWTYLAFAGQLQAPSWLGSVATHGPSGFGGGALIAGQSLQVTDSRQMPYREGSIACPVWARPRALIHAVAGPQDRFFDADTLATFGTAPFQLTDACDRMGVRLRGPVLMPEAALSIPSEPILRGSVQVSGDGVATVLLADHQTTGGYPKIATLLDDDLDGFAQLRPRDTVRFRLIAPQTAVAIARQRAGRFQAYLARL